MILQKKKKKVVENMAYLKLHPVANTPGGSPFEEIPGRNNLYSQESFCEMKQVYSP